MIEVPHNDLTQKEYNLKCLVLVKHMSAQQGLTPGAAEFNAVILVPEINDEAIRFLNAWCPEVENEHFEFAAFLKAPINLPTRLSIHLPDRLYSKSPYLFVMSKGIEEILVNLNGRIINIQTLKASADSEADETAEPGSEIQMA